jgi:hypothetical protein
MYYLETPFKDSYEFAVFEKIKRAEISFPKVFLFKSRTTVLPRKPSISLSDFSSRTLTKGLDQAQLRISLTLNSKPTLSSRELTLTTFSIGLCPTLKISRPSKGQSRRKRRLLKYFKLLKSKKRAS